MGNTHRQAQLAVGTLILLTLFLVLRKTNDILQASFFLTAGAVLLSPNAFPWYFTWSIPYLCFYPRPAWLLMGVTALLGYAPVIEYSALGVWRDSPLILLLEYLPVYCLLVVELWRVRPRFS